MACEDSPSHKAKTIWKDHQNTTTSSSRT